MPAVAVGAGFAFDRERAEALLAESEERLRLAHEAAGIGTWDWDIATGAIQWSPRTYALHGMEPASGPLRTEVTAVVVRLPGGKGAPPDGGAPFLDRPGDSPGPSGQWIT